MTPADRSWCDWRDGSCRGAEGYPGLRREPNEAAVLSRLLHPGDWVQLGRHRGSDRPTGPDSSAVHGFRMFWPFPLVRIAKVAVVAGPYTVYARSDLWRCYAADCGVGSSETGPVGGIQRLSMAWIRPGVGPGQATDALRPDPTSQRLACAAIQPSCSSTDCLLVKIIPTQRGGADLWRETEDSPLKRAYHRPIDLASTLTARHPRMSGIRAERPCPLVRYFRQEGGTP
jgi:hypothetical protein